MRDHDKLIDELCAAAGPVSRVAPSWARAAFLVPLMLALGWAATTVFHRTVTDWSLPDAATGIVNAALSWLIGGAAFIQALDMSIAGRKIRGTGWMAFALLAWLAVAAFGIGSPLALDDAYREGRYCFSFLMVAGLPMSVVAILALRRTRALRPIPSLITAGFGIAFLGFGLLAFCHPAATTIPDTLGHLAAALVLDALTTTLGVKAIAA